MNKRNKKSFLTLAILVFYFSFTIFGFSYKNVNDTFKGTIFFYKDLVNLVNLNFLDVLKEVLDISNLVKTLPKQSKKNKQQDESKLIDLFFISCSNVFKINLQYFSVLFIFSLIFLITPFNKNDFVYNFYVFSFIFLKLLRFIFFAIYAPRSGIPEGVILHLRVLILSHKFLWDKIRTLLNKPKRFLLSNFYFNPVGLTPFHHPFLPPFWFSPFISNERGLNSLVIFEKGGPKKL